MIAFDLRCPADHVFEAWFGSSDAYEDQLRRGLVACPLCGAIDVAKAVMAPNVAAKGNSRAVVPAAPPGPASAIALRGGPAVPAPMPAEVKAALAALARAQAKALEGSEHVGRRFASEARAIQAGDAPERVIHGQATPAEARALVEDGVPVAPLPLPIVPPDQLQ